MTAAITFALNHIAAPSLDIGEFFALARKLGLDEVEIRNDLTGVPIFDGTPAETVRREAQPKGVRILTINALQRFNEWTERRAAEARELASYAHDCGARALVLVPVNDEAFRPGDEMRLAGLREALTALKPILTEAGLSGFVEPLGFAISSLRSKREATAAIDAVGGADIFRLVHDSFHHHLAGEAEIFPLRTGLVHISGVDDHRLAVADMRDAHRVLVGEADRLGNLAQIAALRIGGYRGPFSFEPFAESVQRSPDIGADLAASMRFIGERVVSSE
ncbi:2-keto-myo-inositol isomerase [Rhizobiales bacterium GAS188]|nr:2-keto-myo-inositol isomerase [Rhizobiales bacterium GAS188]